jgi:hypothetical protein
MRNTPAEGEGVGCQLGGYSDIHSRNTPETQPLPCIHVRRDGALYRVQVIPPDALGETLSRPDSYASVTTARMGAKVLSDMTGWPVTDLTEGARA